LRRRRAVEGAAYGERRRRGTKEVEDAAYGCPAHSVDACKLSVSMSVSKAAYAEGQSKAMVRLAK